MSLHVDRPYRSRRASLSPTTRHRRSAGAPGYSLAEVVVVVSILAVLMAIATVVMSRARANRQLDASANELLAVCKYARQVAQSQSGATVAFAFPSGSAPTWSVVNSSSQTLKQGTLQNNVTLTVPSGMNPLAFQPDGSVTSGGTMTLTASLTQRTAQLSVNQTTGSATLTIQ